MGACAPGIHVDGNGGDAGGHEAGLRSYQVIEVAGELRGIGQQCCRGQEILSPTRLVREEEERFVLTVIVSLSALSGLWQEDGSADCD